MRWPAAGVYRSATLSRYRYETQTCRNQRFLGKHGPARAGSWTTLITNTILPRTLQTKQFLYERSSQQARSNRLPSNTTKMPGTKHTKPCPKRARGNRRRATFGQDGESVSFCSEHQHLCVDHVIPHLKDEECGLVWDRSRQCSSRGVSRAEHVRA